MKTTYRLFLSLLILSILIGLLPAMQSGIDASASPALVLSSTTAVNPILDHVLDYDTFGSGGPFTVSFEWKAFAIKDNDPSDRDAGHAFVRVIGTVNGSTTQEQADPQLTIKGNTDWTSVSFTFQNVGIYSVTGENIPGNILRFGMWKAKGELSVRNLRITDASGAVRYSLNTDSVVAQAVSNAASIGLTEFAMSELAAIDFADCPWTPGQFSTGNYSAYIRIEGNNYPTTTTKKIYVDPPFTTSSTTQTTTTVSTATSTVKPSTAPTTKPTAGTITTVSTVAPIVPGGVCTHNYICGICMNCFELDPDFRHPCLDGHDFDENGACKNCSIYDPDFFDYCTDGHDLDENGQCRECPYFEQIADPEPLPDHTEPEREEVDNSGFLIVLIVVASLLLVGVVVVIILLLRKKK